MPKNRKPGPGHYAVRSTASGARNRRRPTVFVSRTRRAEAGPLTEFATEVVMPMCALVLLAALGFLTFFL